MSSLGHKDGISGGWSSKEHIDDGMVDCGEEKIPPPGFPIFFV